MSRTEQTKTRNWMRPDHIPFPSVWCRFNGCKEISGRLPKFWIQDIPEDQWEIVIKYMTSEFVNEEPLSKYSGNFAEPQALQDFRDVLLRALQDRVGLICYMENPDATAKPIIAAMNCTSVACKEDPPLEPMKGKASQQIVDTMSIMHHMRDPFEALLVDKYLQAFGLYVLPEFRGQGLGLELLKARQPICEALGIKASVTIFTSIASQIVAKRAGFYTLSEISYADLQQQHPTIRYPGIEEHTKDLKCMCIKFA